MKKTIEIAAAKVRAKQQRKRRVACKHEWVPSRRGGGYECKLCPAHAYASDIKPPAGKTLSAFVMEQALERVCIEVLKRFRQLGQELEHLGFSEARELLQDAEGKARDAFCRARAGR